MAVALGALLAVAAVGALLDGSVLLIAAVAVAGAVAVVISYLRAAREREARLLETRREVERTARRTRDQLEAMLRGVADAVTAQAPDGRLLFANDAAVELLGFESSEALLAASPADLMSRFEIFDESGRPYPVEDFPWRRALAGEEGAEAIMRVRVRATGEERWSTVKATPIKNGVAGVSMAINVIEDITAHKRAELAQGFLARSSTVLGRWLDSDELLTRVARLAVPEMADWCAVDLVTEDGALERVALTHADPALREPGEELSRRYPPDPATPRGAYEVMRSGEPELFPEVTEELLRESSRDHEHYELLSRLGVCSAMIVPMRERERTLGILTFATGPSGHRYDERDLEMAHELARRCATAIDNNRLYTERSYVARTLEQSLLPGELPDIPGIEAAARFRHSGEGGEVGGDFYDLFATGPRGWTVVMGDVCGKGPDAAAVTALARYTLRAAAMRDRLPSRSLLMLNEALLRQRRDRRFCTVAYAYLEPLEDGAARVGFASAGHPLPLLVHREGTVETVGEPGTLLGVLPEPRFEDRAVSLSPGDALVFYTDGVIEARGNGEPLGEAGLARLVGACAGRNADAIAAEVERAAVASHDGRPRDDIAVLVLRVAS